MQRINQLLPLLPESFESPSMVSYNPSSGAAAMPRLLSRRPFCIAVVTRRVLLLDSEGNAQPLTDQHLQGSTLTLASIRAMLLARSGGGGGRRRVPDEDDDDEDGEEDEDEDPYWGPSRRKPKQWYDVVTEPQEAGVRLERAGEFGPVCRSEHAGERAQH